MSILYTNENEHTFLILPVVKAGVMEDRTSFHSWSRNTLTILRAGFDWMRNSCRCTPLFRKYCMCRRGSNRLERLTRRLVKWSKSLTKMDRINSTSIVHRLGVTPSKKPNVSPYFATISLSCCGTF